MLRHGQVVLHNTTALHVPSFGQVLLCTTNKWWPHSTFMSLEASNFYLTSVLLIPQHLATSQGKYVFKNKSIPTVKDALQNHFFTCSLFSSCSRWLETEPFPPNPFKPRMWCRYLIMVILFPAHSFGYILIVTLMFASLETQWIGKKHNPIAFLQLSSTPNKVPFPFRQGFW